MPGAPFARERVALVYVPGAPAGQRNVGSGYFVDDRRVLTAAHVVGEQGTPCRVRPQGRDYLEATVAWRGAGHDLALLRLAREEDVIAGWAPVGFGAVAGDERIPCRAVGFPDAQVHRGAAGRTRRKPEGIQGEIEPLSGDVQEELTIHVEGSVPREAGEKTTRWAGISGAALFAGPHLVGVIAVDPAAFGEDRLLATPLVPLAGDEGFLEAVGVSGLLDLGAVRAPVSGQAASAVVGLVIESAEFTDILGSGPRGPQPFPQFMSIEDERAALISIRLELEEKLRVLARAVGLDEDIGLRKLPERLARAGAFDDKAAQGLRTLIDIGDRIIEGASVREEAGNDLRDRALWLIYALEELRRRADEEKG